MTTASAEIALSPAYMAKQPLSFSGASLFYMHRAAVFFAGFTNFMGNRAQLWAALIALAALVGRGKAGKFLDATKATHAEWQFEDATRLQTVPDSIKAHSEQLGEEPIRANLLEDDEHGFEMNDRGINSARENTAEASGSQPVLEHGAPGSSCPIIALSPRALATSWQQHVGARVAFVARVERSLDFTELVIRARDGTRFAATLGPEQVWAGDSRHAFIVAGAKTIRTHGKTVLPLLFLDDDCALWKGSQ